MKKHEKNKEGGSGTWRRGDGDPASVAAPLKRGINF